jgi:PII-like signaling protein
MSTNFKLLRIFIGETDKYDHKPLYEALLYKGREDNIAGGAVTRGIMSYGASGVLHTAKLMDIAEDLPVTVEFVDTEEKIGSFMKTVAGMMEGAGCGGMATIQPVEVVYYKPGANG